MGHEAYSHYVRLLSLRPNASEQEIRAALDREQRTWTRNSNMAPTLEKRQEADRRLKALDEAEQVLFGLEGRVARSLGENPGSADALTDPTADAQTVARAIESVARERGIKAQRREGTVLQVRASVFFRGVDYAFEQAVHKRYEAARDWNRCTAHHGAVLLFDWTCGVGVGSAAGKVEVYVPGPWVADLVTFRNWGAPGATSPSERNTSDP